MWSFVLSVKNILIFGGCYSLFNAFGPIQQEVLPIFVNVTLSHTSEKDYLCPEEVY